MRVTPEHEKEFEKAVKEDRKKRCKCSIFNIIDTKRSGEIGHSEVCDEVFTTDKDVYSVQNAKKRKKLKIL